MSSGDRAELSRIVHHAWCASKNSSNVVVLALGWGDGQVIKSGGEAACLEKTLQGWAVHHKSGRLWVVNTSTHKVQVLAFQMEAEDPTGL